MQDIDERPGFRRVPGLTANRPLLQPNEAVWRKDALRVSLGERLVISYGSDDVDIPLDKLDWLVEALIAAQATSKKDKS